MAETKMIDENRLDKIDLAYALRMSGCVPDDECDEIDQLARLGLWARLHAITSLKFYGSGAHLLQEFEAQPWTPFSTVGYTANNALAALPKESV